MSDEKEELSPEEAQKLAAEANRNRNNERLAAMEAIADNSEKGRPEQFDEAEQRELDAAAEDAAATAEAQRLQTEGAVEEKDTDSKTVNGELYYRQIVNGNEKWQTIKQIRDAAQKVESADDYLRQASESVRSSARAALSPRDEQVKVSKADLADLLRRVALGEDEAIERLASVIDSRPSEVTPDVLRAVDQRLSFRTEMALLETEQKEILEDPMLSELFQSRLARMKQEAPDTALATAYRTIGKEIRDRFGIALKNGLKDKLDRKRTLPQVPSAATRQAAAPDEEGEEDVGSVIERMAKARGQNPIVHSRR